MTFLPIADRELRIAARRPVTFRIRWIAALGCLILWFLMGAGNHRLSTAEFSKLLFTAFGIVAFGFALLSGIFLTADCLSEEKREGTLGLLFLTPLKGYDIVFGKLMATSMNAIYAMLAIFPILALPLLMGGVSPGEFWRLMLVLVAAVLLSLGVGMLVSAYGREARQSIGGTLLVLIFLAGILPALWWLHRVLFNKGGMDFLLLPSPAYTFRGAFDYCYALRNGPLAFWGSLGIIFTIGAGCLTAAALLLPRRWQDDGISKSSTLADGSERKRLLILGRSPELDADPCFWLASRDRSASKLIGLSIGGLFMLWAVFLSISLFSNMGREAYIIALFSSYAFHQVVKCFMAIEATRQLSSSRHSGALELLLATPLSEKSILNGYARAFRERFKTLAKLAVFLNGAMLLAALASSNLSMNKHDRAVFFELFLGGAIVLWCDFRAIESAGAGQAIDSSKHSRAVLGTLLRVMLPPWIGIFLMIFLLQTMFRSASGAAVLFGFWLGFGVVTSLVVKSAAEFHLAKGIRTLISEPRSPSRAGFTSFFQRTELKPANV